MGRPVEANVELLLLIGALSLRMLCLWECRIAARAGRMHGRNRAAGPSAADASSNAAGQAACADSGCPGAGSSVGCGTGGSGAKSWGGKLPSTDCL